MAIDIDTTQPLRRPLELQQLVEAVVAAGSADEALWVECKNNGFDLTKAEGRFNAARVILSFANRMPDTASTVCGGLAYLIIGAEPGQVDGTAVIDAADLDTGLIKYLGGDGPRWSPNYVTVHGRDVLVILVEAPRWGDRIHALRRQLEGAQAGTVYVRSQSVSRPANPEELRRLEDRLLRGHQGPEIDGLQVGYTIGAPDHEAGRPKASPGGRAALWLWTSPPGRSMSGSRTDARRSGTTTRPSSTAGRSRRRSWPRCSPDH